MPRKYRRGFEGGLLTGKTVPTRGRYDQGSPKRRMEAAIRLVKEEKWGYKAAAKSQNVGRHALWNRLNNPNLQPHVGFQSALPSEVLDIFAQAAKGLSEMGYPLNRFDFRELVGEYCRENGIEAFGGGMPSNEWMDRFLADRPELVLRIPEQLAVARATAFNVQNVTAWYNLVESIYDRYPSLRKSPNRIFNADETSFCTDKRPSAGSKVIAQRGIRNVSQVTEGSGRTNYTVLACAAADGTAIPPRIVYKGTNYQKRWETYLGD